MTAKSKIRRPPGPKGNFFLGNALEFAEDPLGFLTETAKKHKHISLLRLANVHLCYLSHPDHIKHVLQVNNKNYHKDIKYEQLKLFLGEGLLTSEGDFWLRQRRIAQPAFHRKEIASFATTMTDCTLQMMERWRNNGQHALSLDIHTEMMVLTLRIVGKTLLSKDMTGDASSIGKSLGYLIEAVNKRIFNVFNLPLWVPTLKNLKFKKEKGVIDEVVLNLIEDRKRNNSSEDDLLSMLMGAKDEETGEGMSTEQLRDEVMTIFVAGHETTANALTWTFYLLSSHPEVEEKLHRELKEVLNGKTPEMEDIPKLKYTLQVIEESMRLFPPAWVIGRRALDDDEIGGFKIKKGDNIIMSPYVMHRDPEYWKDPEKFDPTRFSYENAKDRSKFIYFPFGGGPRFCIGSNFALMEMQLLVATIAQRFRLRLAPGHKVEKNPLVTLRPKYGMMMNLEDRI
ncbi:MAG: cytochrome P450 [Bacteroidetes bacterium]|nr:cytochrome P450 [Bacteroidota bacterium]